MFKVYILKKEELVTRFKDLLSLVAKKVKGIPKDVFPGYMVHCCP